MQVIDASEAALRFRELLEEVEKGSDITIAQDGKPVARLSAARLQQAEADQLPSAIRRVQQIARAHTPRIDARELWHGGRRF
jgi:prevent-host-death family protein